MRRERQTALAWEKEGSVANWFFEKIVGRELMTCRWVFWPQLVCPSLSLSLAEAKEESRRVQEEQVKCLSWRELRERTLTRNQRECKRGKSNSLWHFGSRYVRNRSDLKRCVFTSFTIIAIATISAHTNVCKHPNRDYSWISKSSHAAVLLSHICCENEWWKVVFFWLSKQINWKWGITNECNTITMEDTRAHKHSSSAPLSSSVAFWLLL
jgi:hypothetical protein